MKSMVEELQQRILKLEKEKQLAQEEKEYGIYQKEVFIRDLQKEQEVTAKRNMELMLFTVSHFSYAPFFQGPHFLTKMLESNILYHNLFIDILSV